MQSGRVNVVFMGSPDFSVPTLELLHRSNRFEVALVVTQPDKPRGRGRKLTPTPVRHCAEELGLPVAVRIKGKYRDLYNQIAALEPDVIVVIAFGLILKKDLLDLPAYGCVNLHASLLPQYRGVAPIPAAVLSGDAKTGCTSMFMDEGIDTGDILLTRELEILADDTAGSVSTKLAFIGAELIAETLEQLVAGTVEGKKQDDALATYTHKLKKVDGYIDWRDGAEQISRLIRAMNPWPTAYTFYNGKRLIILQARPVEDQTTSPPGAVISIDPLTVRCGTGALEIMQLIVQGRGVQREREFVSGYRVRPGDQFTCGAVENPNG